MRKKYGKNRGKRGYSGKYIPKNLEKYIGNKKNIIWRSLWERGFFKYCDNNNNILKWASEPFFINYFDKGNNKYRKYYPDIYMEMKNGKKYLIEIKPKFETEEPKKPKRATKKHLLKEQTFLTNCSKWSAAELYCKKREWEFKIVTEITLEKMGIKIIK